jgi:PAS domain S-box-containing protein
MLGATRPESLLGKPMLDFIHPDYREIAAERVRQLTAEGIAICPSEERWLRLDGTAIDVEVVAMPVIHKGEPAVQLIVRKHDQHAMQWSARIRHPVFGLRRRHH